MDKLTVSDLKAMLLAVAEHMMAQREELCRIDAETGDGDHGIGMFHGFEKVTQLLENREFSHVNELFQQVGMGMLGAMGGASGVIFATLFMGAAKGTPDAELDADAFAARMDAGLQAVMQRGKAAPGDKTMVDALAPACAALRETAGDLTARLAAAADAAARGAEATRDYVAKFGRAKALMERAVGHLDAGAVSVAHIFRAMADWAAAKE